MSWENYPLVKAPGAGARSQAPSETPQPEKVDTADVSRGPKEPDIGVLGRILWAALEKWSRKCPHRRMNPEGDALCALGSNAGKPCKVVACEKIRAILEKPSSNQREAEASKHET